MIPKSAIGIKKSEFSVPSGDFSRAHIDGQQVWASVAKLDRLELMRLTPEHGLLQTLAVDETIRKHLMQTKPRHHKNPFPPLIAILAIIVLATTSSARNHLWREAVPLWEDAARKAPGKARAYHVLGLAAYTGGVDAAIGYFLTVLRIKPDYVHTYTSLAACYGSKGMHDKSIEYSYLALKIKPDFEEAYYSLGVAFASQGLLDKAREHLATALRIKPDHKEALKLLQAISDRSNKSRM